MEEFSEAFNRAKRNLMIADHMIYMTYSVVKDPRLLLTVLENVFLALSNGISAVLNYENLYKRVDHIPDSFEEKLNAFLAVAERLRIDTRHLSLIKEVKEIIIEHKDSPMEFVRNDRFVICSNNYEMKVISVEQIKNYIGQTKNFLAEVSTILQNERVLG